MPYDLERATLTGPFARVFEPKFDYKKDYIPQSASKDRNKVWFLFVIEDEERNIGD